MFSGAEALVQQAREWESNGEYQRAVECYVKVTNQVTQDLKILEKCWLKVSEEYRSKMIETRDYFMTLSMS